MLFVRLALIASAAVILAACSAKDAALIPAELSEFEATASIKSRWHASLGGNARTMGIGPFKTGRVYSRPMFGSPGYQRFFMATDEDVIYATNPKGRVYAVKRETGRILWSRNIKHPISAGVSFHDGLLFVGTLDGDVFALSSDDGSIIWQAVVSTEVVAPPQSNGDEVLVTTIDGRLFALGAGDGKRLWSYDHPQPLLTFRSQASPLLMAKQAFVAFDNGQLLSFGTKEGELRWSVRVSQPQGITELERAVDLDVTPMASGPFIFAAGANGRLVAVSKGSGKITWAEDASIFNELVNDGEALFYVDDKSHLHSRRLSSGKSLWKSEALHRRDIGSPVIVGDYIAMVDGSNYLHLFDRSNGELAARRSLPGSGYSTPLLAEENTLYIFSNNGALNAYEIAPK